MLDVIRSIIFPRFCIICFKPGSYVCEYCAKAILSVEIQECVMCGRLCAYGNTHRVCMDDFSPTKHLSTFIYSSVVKRIILDSKNHVGAYRLLDVLIYHPKNLELLITNLRNENIDFLTFAPMTPKLFETRAINHAQYISSRLSSILNIPSIQIFTKLPGKTQKSQGKLSRGFLLDRFRIVDMKIDLKDKNILIIDDICTTGNTIYHLSAIARKSGCNKVLNYTLGKDLLYNKV